MATLKLKTKKQIRKAWVALLKSGKLRQGTSALATKTPGKHYEYCCLGVLCELATKAGVIKKTPANDTITYKAYGSNEKYFLTKEVMEWAGISSNDGSYGSANLASQNDNGKSFKEIAKIIESNPVGLFTEEN